MYNFIIDIDGTIVQNDQPINNSVAFIQQLQNQHYDFLLATNSIIDKPSQINRLNAIGINITANQLYSPIDAINIYLATQRIKTGLIIGSTLEVQQIHCEHNSICPEIIILLDFEKNDAGYCTLQNIIDFAQKGIPIITASRSLFYLKNSHKQIDTGAFVALIESITQTTIDVIGKPSTDYFINASHSFKNQDLEILVIGDDYQTDIQGAKAVNFKTALVQSGKYHVGDEKHCQPDFCITEFTDLHFFE
ncbi:HAD-IIA family hydrolase [Marinicellulosiphila megalodicopiae]|uniref:HAD-IIA family hydrolase n=1 Tax=Marinicellulosiphila megalodicopiae TaxID=2724896 RepID=UPI003BAE9070